MTKTLSREKIARAALDLADAEGFAAVSMRRVALELNVGTMSLYYYVRTKDDLVSLMDDALMGEVLLKSVPKNWKRAITVIASRTRTLFLRHPWALLSMLSAPPGLNGMRHMEQCLEALKATSMTSTEKLTFLALVDDYVFGHALRAASETHPDPDWGKRQIQTGEFPQLEKIYKNCKILADEDRFKMGLKMLLDSALS